MNESELVQRLRARDPDAVRHLTDRYLPSVWRFVFYRVNGDRHLAEDIVSESVLALMRAATSNVEIENPGGWLRSVASHKILDHVRAAARVQHLIAQVGRTAEMVDHKDAVQHQETEDRRAEVRQVMDDLPDQQRVALEWKYIEKLSVREIAGRLAVTEKAAESILFRARRTFRGKMVGISRDDDEPGSGCGTDAMPASQTVDAHSMNVEASSPNAGEPVKPRR